MIVTWFESYLHNFELVNKLTTMKIFLTEIYAGRTKTLFFPNYQEQNVHNSFPRNENMHFLFGWAGEPRLARYGLSYTTYLLVSSVNRWTDVTWVPWTEVGHSVLRLRKIAHANVTSGFLSQQQPAEQKFRILEYYVNIVVVQYHNNGSG